MEDDETLIPLRDITRIQANPGDTLLFRLVDSATLEDCQWVKECLDGMLPEVNIVVSTGIEGVERVAET